MMNLLGDFLLSNIATASLIVITLTILYFKYAYTYWSRRNVPFVQPTIPFGNFSSFILQKRSIGDQLTLLYNELKKSGKKVAGIYMFSRPIALLLDPEICKSIMAKDFQYFSSRTLVTHEKREPLTGHLLNLNGVEWKNMRSKLTPTFTSGKMKMMFQTLVACSEELETILDKYAQTGEVLEVKDMMGRFTTDIIGSCAFGIDCNSLKEPDNEFRKHGKRIVQRTAWDAFSALMANNFPKLASLLGLKILPPEPTSFFMNLVKETVDYRERNNVIRNDFMHLLIQLKKQGYIDEEDLKDKAETRLSLNQISAQAFVFFIAGFETSSTTLSAFMYEMCLHPDVQDKVRNEINEVLKKHDGKLTYDTIMEMTYLEKAINETMRLHSVAPALARTCIMDYQMPDTDIIIKKGTVAFVPVKGFHRDPEYYPNPEMFDPERFSPEEKAKRHPYTFLPFGAGPRNCIGLRFGMLQMKVGIITFLKNHRFTLNSKTQTPLRQNPKIVLYNILGGIWVNAERVK